MCLPACLPACVPACLPASLPACLRPCLQLRVPSTYQRCKRSWQAQFRCAHDNSIEYRIQNGMIVFIRIRSYSPTVVRHIGVKRTTSTGTTLTRSKARLKECRRKIVKLITKRQDRKECRAASDKTTRNNVAERASTKTTATS